MKNKHKILMIMLIVGIIILSACTNSSDQSSVSSKNPSADTDSTQKDSDISLNEDQPDINEAKQEDVEEVEEESKSSEQVDASEYTAVSDSNQEDSKDILTKNEYLKKLNEMEEADRNSEAGTTIAELEDQENQRYEKWDEELNKIYGILTEQLSSEEMDKLREEQRDWIDYRDETAKESSLEYEGGSTEALEYVATQATLTRERCYLLVSQYMK